MEHRSEFDPYPEVIRGPVRDVFGYRPRTSALDF
jgi:hypothetical protein